MDTIKRMDIKEFRELGLLVELNRTFLHPLGLALEVNVDDEGNETLGGIWDYRDDPEGMLYQDGEGFPTEKVLKAQAFITMKHIERYNELGFVYQEIPGKEMNQGIILSSKDAGCDCTCDCVEKGE